MMHTYLPTCYCIMKMEDVFLAPPPRHSPPLTLSIFWDKTYPSQAELNRLSKSPAVLPIVHSLKTLRVPSALLSYLVCCRWNSGFH